MMDNLPFFSATDLLAGYRRKAFSPVEATRAVFQQIERHNGKFNAFCLLDEEAAMAAARESEARWMAGMPRGLVDGVPTTIKDLLITKGWPTLRGSTTIAPDQVWAEDAPAVARLREHGAVFIGKTTTPEFGWKPLTDSILSGITRNPWNAEMTAGGSSGGATVAAALGMGALHLGTDAAGSIRIPSSFSGVFGLKPTHGRVASHPATPNSGFAHVGPMARTVTDAALMLSVIARYDPRDSYALPPDSRDWRIGLEQGVHGLRIAFAPTLDGARVDPSVAAIVRDAAQRFSDLGALVEEREPPLAGARESLLVLYRAAVRSLVFSMPPGQREKLEPALLEFAEQVKTVGLAEYLEATRTRERLMSALNTFFQRYDLLMLPTVPIVAFEAGQLMPKSGEYSNWFDWTPFSAPFNLTKVPAASIPCGLHRGLPVGLQVVGPLFREDLVLTACRAFESLCPVVCPAH